MKQEVQDLEGGAQEIAWALRRRGLSWVGGNGQRELLFADSDLTSAELDDFFQQMHSYAFRLFLRDLIHHRDGFGIQDLLHYVDPETASTYLKRVEALRFTESLAADRWRLRSLLARSFGETLEWYVARLFSHGFGCASTWGVRAHATGNGGDYDVLALVENRLVCVEVKSAPPKHILPETIENFLRRVEELGPALSLFVEDTHLRLEDKIIPMFTEALQRRTTASGVPYEIRRERPHLYCIQRPAASGPALPWLFIFSSRPSMESNLNHCLRRLLVPDFQPLPEKP